VNAFDLDKDKI